MTLSELLQHLRCNVLRDTALPQLWSDTELLRYLNQAQKEFARRTHCLIDDSSSFTTFNTVAGTQTYSLDKRIVQVTQAGTVEYDDQDPPVETSYHYMRDRTRHQARRRFSSGRPCVYTAQAKSHSIRFDPTPDQVYIVEMEVARLPLNDLVNAKDVPEIDEDYHLTLTDFAAWRALTNNDPEGANMTAAKEFRAVWDLNIRDVKREMSALRSGVNPQARTNWTGKRRSIY